MLPPTPLLTSSELVERTARHLDWACLLEAVAGESVGESAASRLQARRPAHSLAEARSRMQLLSEALDADTYAEPVPQPAAPDIAGVVARVRRGGVATALELLGVAKTLAVAHGLRAYAKSQAERRPRLAEALDSSAALDPLRERLQRALEADGTIADSASPELRRARREAAEMRRELQRVAVGVMRRYESVLRDQDYTERDGRYVLPVRSDAHLRVPGIVLGSSGSGGTLYVEPHELTGLGNQLQLAEAEVEREEQRILAELSAAVGEGAAEVLAAWEACIAADTLAAMVRFAKRIGGVAVNLETRPRLQLRSLRHPLLALSGEPVIPNDVALEGGHALILSGPNAGGKTVLLKSVGLALWMARAGLPVPVEPQSVIGWFDPVLADIGDEQSVFQSLSTFSGHIRVLASLLAVVGPNALILLDEIASGTDPEEGSALAAALLEAMVERGAAAIVTTHYERLKELAAKHPALENGCVGFDLETLSPTFLLSVGAPGPSTALAVARRYGIPGTLVDHAESLIPRTSVDRERLVRDLEQERSRLQQAREQTEEELRKQQQLASEIERERKTVREKERNRLERQSAELVEELQEARALLRSTKQRLRGNPVDAATARELERAVDRAARPAAIGGKLQSALQRSSDSAEGAPRLQDLRPGTRVYLPRLAAKGEVVEVSAKGVIRVQVGALKLQAGLDELRLSAGATRSHGSGAPAPRTASRRRGAPELELQSADNHLVDTVRTSSNTLDLRGQRVEASLDEVDRFLDQLLRRGETSGFVLHGHGTGALKLAVRAHLSAHPVVGKTRPAERDEGGDAFTIFWLGQAG